MLIVEFRLANPKDRALHKIIINKQLGIIWQNMAIYWPTQKKKILDIIDFRVIKGITKKNFSIKISLDLFSDHSPIIINVNNEVIKKMQPCMLY